MTTSGSSRERWFHPLITQVDPSINRRRLLRLGTGGLAAIAARPALHIVSAQEATPEEPLETGSPEATPDLAALLGEGVTGDEDAVAILRNAANVMAELSSFTFELETTRGESTIFQGLDVREISGAVRRPADFTATVSVGVPFGTIDVTAIGVDGMAWVQDSLAGDDSWIPLEASEDILALINPDTLILGSIGLIQDAQVDGTEAIDGVEATRITGTVDFAETAERLSGGSAQIPDEIAAEPLPVTVWIDPEGRVLEIEVVGRIVLTESEDVVRVIRFMDFNEPVEIEPPPV